MLSWRIFLWQTQCLAMMQAMKICKASRSCPPVAVFTGLPFQSQLGNAKVWTWDRNTCRLVLNPLSYHVWYIYLCIISRKAKSITLLLDFWVNAVQTTYISSVWGDNQLSLTFLTEKDTERDRWTMPLFSVDFEHWMGTIKCLKLQYRWEISAGC